MSVVTEQVAAQLRRIRGDAMVFCAACMRDNLPVRFTYRCFDCGRWYCEACMADHMGRGRIYDGEAKP